MAQQISLILVLAFCALALADIELTGQPMQCSVATPPANKTELLDFTQLVIAPGGRSFEGSIEIKKDISSLQVRISYVEFNNGDGISNFRDNLGDLCVLTTNIFDDSPASNFIDRVLELSPSAPVLTCVPPIQAKIYDMDDVEINQTNLQDLDEESSYDIEIELESDEAYSCIRLNGNVVPDTL